MLTGKSDNKEALPPPPWESQASDDNPFYDNQMGFQTTYPTQQSQPYRTQLPQQYLIQQPQPYPTQQHQLYPTQQHQPYLTQQPQQKQVKQSGFVIGQDLSLQPMEIPTNSPYSQMQNASLTNQQPMYAAHSDPYYNQNMYTYGALNQENISIYNSQMPTSIVQ